MFEQKGNVFVAYDLIKEGKQSLGNMEKIELAILTINEIKQLLFESKILNAASIVAFYKAIDYHEIVCIIFDSNQIFYPYRSTFILMIKDKNTILE